MAENQSYHRIQMEKEFAKKASFDARLGIAFGFLIVMFALLSSAFLIYVGKDSGIWLGSISLVALISIFVYGTRMKR